MIPKRKKKIAKHAGLPFALPGKKRGEDRKKMEKELDVLFSEYVRLKANGQCWLCKKVVGFKKLSTHHVYSRSSRSGRWLSANARSLCWPCHKFRAHKFTEEFRAKVIEEMGQKAFDWLMMVCMSRTKYTVGDLKMIRIDLKRKIEVMGGK